MSKDKDQIVAEITDYLLKDPALAWDDSWADLSLIVELSPTTYGLSGFQWDKQGNSEPSGPTNEREFIEKFRELYAVTNAEGKTPWNVCIFRLNRASCKGDAEFRQHNEDSEDKSTWMVDPNNFEKSKQALRYRKS